ncbi:MAG: hypothetical protein P1V97_21915 [Planctomycetota bacterium]|nr:hypothetical protein [Planctomycetota bacterium]
MNHYLDDLNSRDRETRSLAREELEALGSVALPELIEILQAESEDKGAEARRGMGRAAVTGVVGGLGGAIINDSIDNEFRDRDINAKARRVAADLVGKLGPSGKPALPALKLALQITRNKAVRGAIREAVKKVNGLKVAFDLVDESGKVIAAPRSQKGTQHKKMKRETYSCPGCESTLRPKRTVRYHPLTFCCFVLAGIVAGILVPFIGAIGLIAGLAIGAGGTIVPKISTYKCRGCGYKEKQNVGTL